MIILAIDPGTEQSALVGYLGFPAGANAPGEVTFSELRDNHFVLDVARAEPLGPRVVVCEMVQNMGMAVGRETFETVRWIGRFQEAVEARGGRFEILYRPDIKLHLCGSSRAKDPNVRQALIDRFGGDSVALKGKKCSRCKGSGAHPKDTRNAMNPWCDLCRHNRGWERRPGPLAGITSHMWSALAVAVTWADLHGKPA